jgi:hypothetical protein
LEEEAQALLPTLQNTMHETIVHKTASSFMKTASFLILKHEHLYVMRFMQVGFLALEHLLPPTSFHHSSNSSLGYYCYYFTGLQYQIRSNL